MNTTSGNILNEQQLNENLKMIDMIIIKVSMGQECFELYLDNRDDSCDHDDKVRQSSVVAQTASDYAKSRVCKYSTGAHLCSSKVTSETA
jgi:hypothetical protein